MKTNNCSECGEHCYLELCNDCKNGIEILEKKVKKLVKSKDDQIFLLTLLKNAAREKIEEFNNEGISLSFEASCYIISKHINMEGK